MILHNAFGKDKSTVQRVNQTDFLEPTGERGAALVDLIDRIFDEGVVIKAGIIVSLAGDELLGIKIRATLASFETAAKYGLEFPSGTNLEARGWKEAQMDKETCPECRKKVERQSFFT